MRKNCERVLRAWHEGKAKGKSGDSIWTDGEHVYSYRTCLLATVKPGIFVFNDTSYSQTTTQHQYGIRTDLQVWTNDDVHVVTDLARGVGPDRIIKEFFGPCVP